MAHEVEVHHCVQQQDLLLLLLHAHKLQLEIVLHRAPRTRYVPDHRSSLTAAVDDLVLYGSAAAQETRTEIGPLAALHPQREDLLVVFVVDEEDVLGAPGAAGLAYRAQNDLAVGVHHQVARTRIPQTAAIAKCTQTYP